MTDISHLERQAFNTGRAYTREGQVITVAYDYENNIVYFNDHSRMVWGEYTPDRTYASRTPHLPLLARGVMDHYDRNDYVMSSAAGQLERGQAEVLKCHL